MDRAVEGFAVRRRQRGRRIELEWNVGTAELIVLHRPILQAGAAEILTR